jgi:glycerophosphoryl diester phosphodiesterase
MKILSHRGYWLTPGEKNTSAAFQRTFEMGFGTETDLRDCAGKIVISHDPPHGTEPTFTDLIALLRRHASRRLTLALNVKADGLVPLLQPLLRDAPMDFFFFDMSVPDMRSYLSAGLPVFTRMSEVEQQPAWPAESTGVWLDAFQAEWYRPDVIDDLLRAGKQVCIVSPELHKRAYEEAWGRLAPLARRKGISICTDLPEEAARFFADKGAVDEN